MDHVKKFRMNAVSRYIRCFALISEDKIFPKVTNKKVKVIPCYHFSERIVERDGDHRLAVKVMSYVFEKCTEKLLKNVDTFIHYKDWILLINSKEEEEGYSVRINTLLNSGSNTWLDTRNGKPFQNISLSLKDLLDYVPISMEKSSEELSMTS